MERVRLGPNASRTYLVALFLLGGWVAIACAEERPAPTIRRVGCVGNDTTNGSSLRRAIETAPPNTTVHLGACRYFVRDSVRYGYHTGIHLSRKENLNIKGAGRAATVVKFPRRVRIGFEIVSDVYNLTIADLTIAGSVTQPLCTEPGAPTRPPCYDETDVIGSRARPATRGIGSTSVRPQVSGVTIRNVYLRDLAVGIDFHASCTDTTSYFRNAVVEGSRIDGIHGTYGGSGYGIWLSCADDVVIRDNVIRRTTRHAIYAGDTRIPNPRPILIARNVIIDHGHRELITPDPFKSVALTIARSDNVTVIDNAFVRSHTYALAAEWEPLTNKSCTRCLFVGNKFLNVPDAPSDIWVRVLPTDTAWLWQNTRGDSMPATVHADRGVGEDVGGAGDFWAGVSAVASVRDSTGVELLAVVRGRDTLNVELDLGSKPDSAGQSKGWTRSRRDAVGVPVRPRARDGKRHVVVAADSLYYVSPAGRVCAAKRAVYAGVWPCSVID